MNLIRFHIHLFWHICKHHLLASFTSYSLQNTRTNWHAYILFDAKQIHAVANIRFRANIRFTFSHTGKYLLQNICFEVNVRKTLKLPKCEIFDLFDFTYFYVMKCL
jgi:hypothetical protein